MAVQAQYPPSSVIENIQTMPMERVTKVLAFPNSSLFSEHPQSGLTCNVSACRKRRRDDYSSALPSSAAALPLISPMFNPSFGTKNCCSSLPVSCEQSLQVLNSCVTSTSGRHSENLMERNIDSLISQHDLETAAYIGLQFDIMRLGMEERRKRYYKSMYSVFEQIVTKRLREKESELEDAKKKNFELEEKFREMIAERQSWFNVAKNNELLVSNLKMNLEQILLQNSLQDAVIPTLEEGYGDSDGDLLPVHGEQSFCFGVGVRAAEPVENWACFGNEVSLNQLSCKVCGVNEICILILPCRHLCLCDNCDSIVGFCPVCNHTKDSSLQVLI